MTETQKKRRNWVRVILVASLALNFLVVGLLAGTALVRGGNKGPLNGAELGLGPYARALAEDDRRAILERLRDHPEIGRSGRQARRAGFELLLEVLRQESVTLADLDEIFEGQREWTLKVQGAGQAALVEQFLVMSLEERQGFADRLEAELRRGPPVREDRERPRP